MFAAEKRGTCIWRVNRTETGLPIPYSASVWAGVCGAPGDRNGAGGSGLARLGYIAGLVAMHVEGFTPILLVSTQFRGCSAVRAISLQDGTVSTLIGSDPQWLPSVLLPQCAITPYIIAVARGTDELLYARYTDVRTAYHERTIAANGRARVCVCVFAGRGTMPCGVSTFYAPKRRV